MGRLLIVSQVYPPDPTAVGQYLADLAEGVAAGGRAVTVLTSASGYADPAQRYPAREVLGGVEVIRLPASSFGKTSIATRLAGAASFLGQALGRGARLGDVDRIFVSTSPPMAAGLGVALARLKRVPLTYWVMDVNPDQAVEMGHFAPEHPAVRAFDMMNRAVLNRSEHVIALDSFMAERLRRKIPRTVSVIPPWALDTHVSPVAHEDNRFRAEQGWSGRTVVMFSGNMSPTSPIDTVVDAAERLTDQPDLVFAFIGGGAGKSALEDRLRRRPMANVQLLPYQPIEMLRYSLSAADIHVVTMGEAMVGITHPCKIYSAMAVGRPLLAVAPEESHVGELLKLGGGKRVDHGDVHGAVAAIRGLAEASADERTRLGRINLEALSGPLAPGALRDRVAQLLG
ncbi:MAG: glycosyltransferase family 4 protein [Myxococcota bacterium]